MMISDKSKKTDKKYSHDTLVPVSTIHQARLRIFQPTRRPQKMTQTTIETAYGKIKIIGKVGQAHADLLEAIMACAEKRAESESGRIKLLVDPAKVRKIANISNSKQMHELLQDLFQVLIEIKNPNNLGVENGIEAGLGHLLDSVAFATRADGTVITRHNPLNRGERNLWRVELGLSLCQLIRADHWLNYNPAPIAKLSHGISQAIARHTLTHRQTPAGGWKLDTLIESVAGPQDSSDQLRNRRREIRVDTEQLEQIGIKVVGDRIFKE